MEFTPEKQKDSSSDETRDKKPEQGQEEDPVTTSQGTMKAVEMVDMVEDLLPTTPRPQEVKANSPRTAIVHETATLEVEDVPHDLSPMVHQDTRKVLDDVMNEESLKILKEIKKHKESQIRLSLACTAATSEAIQDKSVTVNLPTQVVRSQDDEGVVPFFGHYDEKFETLDEKEELKSSEGVVDKLMKEPVRLSQQSAESGPSIDFSINDSFASIASFSDSEVENSFPKVALEKISRFFNQSDLTLEFNRLQQQVVRLKAVNLQKDAEMFELAMKKPQIKDSANTCNSDAASFYLKLQEAENELKIVRDLFEHVSRNCEKVTRQLESGGVALSDLSKMCTETLGRDVTALNRDENLYKASVTLLENNIESFEGFEKEVQKTVSETNAFIDKTLNDLTKNKDMN